MNRNHQSVLFCAFLFALSVVAPAMAAEGVVNINEAGIDELSLLPRVGPAVAQRIIDFRDENGSFKAPEDLLLVRGIGDRTFALMEPHVAVKGDTTLAEKVRVARAADED